MKLSKGETIEYISSTEHLDTPLTIIGIKGWLFLLFSIVFFIAVIIWSFLGTIPVAVTGKSILYDPSSGFNIHSTVTGVVKKVDALTGDRIKKGQTVLVLEDGSEVVSPYEGLITWINIVEGSPISQNNLLFSIQRTDSIANFRIYVFLPLNATRAIQPGMEALCEFAIVDSSVYGLMKGLVREVLPYPISSTEYHLLDIPSQPFRDYLVAGPIPSVLVLVDPVLDLDTVSGFAWTSERGPPERIPSGSIGQCTLIMERIPPISYLIPALRKKST